MADEFELPPDEPEDALAVEGDEPEVDETDDELVTDPVGEPEEEPIQQQGQIAERPISKASQAVMRAKAEAKAAKEERDKLQKEMMDMLRGQQQRPVYQEDPRIEAQRVAQLPYEEQVEYRFNKLQREQQAQMGKLSLQLEMMNDKNSFDAHIAARPEFKRFAGKVEDRFHQLAQAGTPQTRKAILRYMIGEMIDEQGPKALKKAREEGAERIRGQRTQPTNLRSNVSNTTEDSEFAAAERRLRQHVERGGFI
jgi:hypothetical protein